MLRGFRGVFKAFGVNKQYFSGFVYSREVIEARKNDLPIVALETTIITHGMPYPDNYETAVNVEDVIRKKGAIPATIGIIKGRIHVGLEDEEIKKLAIEAGGPKSAIKCSQRDICAVVAGGLNGGTTVGGTLTIAQIAGIPVMATGGIGGVHRGAEKTFDISSDLLVLGRTPVAVVCAGVKAILDIPKTLEFLETLGVPVMTVGETETFPAFYSRSTSDYLKSPMRVLGPEQAADCIKAQRDLGINSGLVFAVPIPQSASLDPLEIEEFIQIALRESEERKIRGKSVTPYLLKRITELTGGKSLAANKILIQNNAVVAAEISLNLSELLNKNEGNYANNIEREKILGSPIVIGGAVEDTILQCEDFPLRFDGRTHKGKSQKSYGGVGRNIAAALVALGVEGTKFLSVVGGDEAGRTIVRGLESAGDTVRKLPDGSTGKYTAVIDTTGECRFAVGDMDIFNSIDQSLIKENLSIIENAKLLILDGNPPVETIHQVIDIAVNCWIPAELAYVKIVNTLQKIRQKDLFDSFAPIYEKTEDPAKFSRPLWDQLISNDSIARKNLNSICNKYMLKDHSLLVSKSLKNRRAPSKMQKRNDETKNPRKFSLEVSSDSSSEESSSSDEETPPRTFKTSSIPQKMRKKALETTETSSEDVLSDSESSENSSEGSPASTTPLAPILEESSDENEQKVINIHNNDQNSMEMGNSAPNFAVSTLNEQNLRLFVGNSSNQSVSNYSSRVNKVRGNFKSFSTFGETQNDSAEDEEEEMEEIEESEAMDAAESVKSVWYEPTDVKKACKIFDSHPDWKKVLHFVTPNVKELFTMAEYFSIKKYDKIPGDGEKELITEVTEKLAEFIPVIVTTMGAEGVLIARKGSKTDPFYSQNNNNIFSLIQSGGIQSRLYPPLLKIDENLEENKYSVSGCGDCLTAGIISGVLKGLNEESCVSLGLKAARLSLESSHTVPSTLRNLR